MDRRQIAKELSSLLFPNCCSVCGIKLTHLEECICLGCLHRLPLTGNFAEPGNAAEVQLAGRFPFERVATYSFFTKQGILQPLMHDLKYNGRREIGVFLGKLFGKDIRGSDFVHDIDFIVPVPLHPKKEKQRGYNQALMIANGLSLGTGIAVSADNLKRVISNPTQTKLSGLQRWHNVAGIFDLENPELLAGKHILLVDDIITTGSTLEACAHALFNSSGIKISIATIGQAL